MDEHIFGTVIAHDEAEALLPVEEFYYARSFTNDLRRHTAACSTACAATTKPTAAASTITKATAAGTATEATTITETAAVTKAAAEAPGTRIGEAAKIVAAETVPLILAASAASPVETHP